MDAVPGRRRDFGVVRRLDHDAVDTRLAASLDDVGRLSRQAGLTSEDVVTRLRSVLGPAEPEPAPFRFAIPARPGTVGVMAVLVATAIIVALVTSRADPASTGVLSSGAPGEAPGVAALEVAGFAELFVAAYLGKAGEGSEDVLDAYLSEPVRLTGVQAGRAYVQNLTTVSVEPAGDGWEVIVVAHTLRKVPGGYGDPAVEHYRVDVRMGEELRAPATPTLISRAAA